MLFFIQISVQNIMNVNTLFAREPVSPSTTSKIKRTGFSVSVLHCC